MANKNRTFKNLTFTLTDDDTLAFNIYFLKNTKAGQKEIWKQRLTFLPIVIGYFALMLILKYDNQGVWFFGGVLVAVAIAYAIVAERIIVKHQEKEIKKNTYNLENVHTEPTHIDCGAESLSVTYKDNSETFEYSDIVRVTRTTAAIYVWVSDIVAVQIPSRAFKNEASRDSLFEFFKENCTNAEVDDNL